MVKPFRLNPPLTVLQLARSSPAARPAAAMLSLSYAEHMARETALKTKNGRERGGCTSQIVRGRLRTAHTAGLGMRGSASAPTDAGSF